MSVTYERLVSTLIASRYNNPRLLTISADQPTLSVGNTADPTFSNKFFWPGHSSPVAQRSIVFNLYGGSNTQSSNGYWAPDPNVSNPGANLTSARVEFNVDSAKFQINVGSYNANTGYRLIVDGHYLSFTPKIIPNSGDQYITVDYSATSGRKLRNVTLEFDSAGLFMGVNVLPIESLYKPGTEVIRMAVVADSFGFGIGATYQANAWPAALGDITGFKDVWNESVGGTGFVANAAGLNKDFDDRLSDLQAANPDVIFVCASVNDLNYTNALGLAVKKYLTDIRALPGFSNKPIVVLGPPSSEGLYPGLNVNVDSTVFSSTNNYITSNNDANIFAVGTIGATPTPLFFGSGTTSAPNGSGNTDIYFEGQSHPIDSGNLLIAEFAADALLQAFITRL